MTEQVTLLPAGHDGYVSKAPQLHESFGGKADGTFAQLGEASRLTANLPAYRKVRAIGRGAFGKAYLVETLQSASKGSREAAPRLQVMKKVSLTGIKEEQREAAYREAFFLRKVSRGCDFIAQLEQVFLGKGGKTLCIVMEYCSGGDLRKAIRDREGMKLDEAQILSWAAQAALGLRHCHGHGVLHRDVKPDNCFFRSQGGDLVLADFGISCAMDTRSFAKTCVGSPHYLSPEIVNQDSYSFSSDVWSYGVMVYEMAALEAPFKGSNICQLAFRIVSATPAPLIGTGYSADFCTLVEALLQKDPSSRASLDQALLASPLCYAAAAVSASHNLDWPPRTSPLKDERGNVASRLRNRIAHAEVTVGVVDSEEYADDFEAYEGEVDAEEQYPDDFEAQLEDTGSEASYEADFEAASDNEDDEFAFCSPTLADFDEAQVRMQLQDESGGDIMAKERVVSFLDKKRCELLSGSR